jgi:hypothetical protein
MKDTLGTEVAGCHTTACIERMNYEATVSK